MCLSVCLSVCEHISRTTRTIFTTFLCIAVARFSIGGVTKSQRKGQFLEIVQATQKQMHRSLQRRCERDLSIANNVMQQKGSLSMPGKCKYYSKNFWAEAMWPIGREGDGGIAVHSADED